MKMSMHDTMTLDSNGNEVKMRNVSDCCSNTSVVNRKKATMSSLRDNPIVTILANEGKDISGKRKLSEDLFQEIIKETQYQDASSDVIKKVTTAEVEHLKTFDHLNGFLLLEPFLEAIKISNPGFIYRLS